MDKRKYEKNIAIVGAGYWGKNLVRNFHSLGALHTVCDSNPDSLRTFTEKYPGVRGELSFSELLLNPEIKGVVISTPAIMHADMVKTALLAGKDVYVEKPLCLSEVEGRELNKIAKEKKQILMVGHLLWYHPHVLKLKSLLTDGALGRMQYIYSNRLNLGMLRREENVLWSFAPHDISVILGLTGEMPESISAQGGNFLHPQIADTTVTLLNFASGIQAHIFVSWLHPFKEQKLVVIGDKKMVVFDDTAPWQEKLQLYPHSIEWNSNVPVANKAKVEYVSVAEDEPLRAECLHFLECLHSRKTPRTDGEEGLRVLQVLNLCQKSMEQGGQISFTPKGSEAEPLFYNHKTAIIDEDVSIGARTKIWHFSHIISGSTIGAECNIGQNVVVGPKAKVGNKCKIQNNVSIYEGVTLEDNVFCGPSMVFTNVYNPRCEFPRKNQYRKTLVKEGATLGANCTIVGGITIGRYAFIGAGAVINHDVPDFALMVGVPATQIGWMSRYGERLALPVEGEGEDECPHTGEKYQLKEGIVFLEEIKNIPQ